MQIKNTMEYHYLSIKIPKSEKDKNVLAGNPQASLWECKAFP